MPYLAFVDNELYEKIEKLNKSNSNYKEEYPEQEFLASCLRVGLTTKDLEEYTYIEIMKTLYSFLEKKETIRRATQEDWDRLAAM